MSTERSTAGNQSAAMLYSARLPGMPAFWLGLGVLTFVSVSFQAQQVPDLAAARQAMDAKQYTTAEQQYRRILQENPSSPQVLTDLGLSLQLQGRSADAMRYYSAALKLKYVPETYALLAEEKCHMGETDSLRPMLQRIYREEVKNLRVISAVAPCYLDIDEPIESAIVYRSLVNSESYPHDLALVQLGKSYIRSGQFFATKLSKAPGSESFLAALRQASDGNPAGARSAFAQAARSSAYFRPELDWAGALDVWRRHPQDTALLYLLSVLSGEEGMRQMQICEDQFPNSPYLQQFYADVLADQGHGEEAIAQYEQLVREHPDLSDLNYSLGLLHEKREEWPAASEAFGQQLAEYPTDERAAAHLSKCMLQMEKYAELRGFLEPRMQAEHPPEWASLSLAEADEKLGNADAAIKILVAAEQDPHADKLVHYRLTHLYSLAGRSADARREYALFQAASKK
ncbi:MAG: tetratricopeptide repeat protein [Terracidiphilus sp.]|jgi:tetratricopeptide (TPR) repeat protein